MQLILNPEYWKIRLAKAAQLHHAVFLCPLEQWERVSAVHRKLLAQHIGPTDSVLDCGCAWGRLLDLLPSTWSGDYLGIDLSPDFVQMAEQRYPTRKFFCADLRTFTADSTFDWAVVVSIRAMVIREAGEAVWKAAEANIKRHARRVLYLEYGSEEAIVDAA